MQIPKDANASMKGEKSGGEVFGLKPTALPYTMPSEGK